MATPVILEPKKGITQKDMAQWIKDGKIQHLYLQTGLRPFMESFRSHGEHQYRYKHCGSIKEDLLKSPLAESIKYLPKDVGCYRVLIFPDECQSDIYFGNLMTAKFYDDFNKPGALMAPLLEKKKSLLGKLMSIPEKLFGAGKETYSINFGKSDIVINLVGTGFEGNSQRSTAYTLGIKCDTDIGNLIFAEACGSEKAAFNFFVKIIPGFEKIEGADFEEYCQRPMYLYSRLSEFSSAKFTSRKDFDALSGYSGKLKIKIS